MSVWFSHGDAQWAYSGFHRFRTRLAKEIGIELDQMENFTDGSNLGLPWADVDDPIVPLLNHSDCDGSLTPEECRMVAPRLRELVDAWDEYDPDRNRALLLADGMDEAEKAGEDLLFI